MKPIKRYSLRKELCSIDVEGIGTCEHFGAESIADCRKKGVIDLGMHCYIPDDDGEYALVKLENEQGPKGQDELSRMYGRLDALKELWEDFKILNDIGKGHSFALGALTTAILERKKELARKVHELTNGQKEEK